MHSCVGSPARSITFNVDRRNTKSKARRGNLWRKGFRVTRRQQLFPLECGLQFLLVIFLAICCLRYHTLFLGIFWKSIYLAHCIAASTFVQILVCQILSQVWSANRRWLAKRSYTFSKPYHKDWRLKFKPPSIGWEYLLSLVLSNLSSGSFGDSLNVRKIYCDSFANFIARKVC